MKNSAIQWTDHTFNAWEGCTKVAPECKNCYAETLVDHRFGRAKWGKGQPRRRTSANLWKQPLAWNKGRVVCLSCGHWHECVNWLSLNPDMTRCNGCHEVREMVCRRPRVFCLSLGDWLDEEVPIEWLADLLKLIHDTPNLDWQLLTKRPQNWMSRMVKVMKHNEDSGGYPVLHAWILDWVTCKSIGNPPGNIWIGVSAGADIEAALDIPAKIHFLSCEPMLHALDTSNDAFKHFDWIIFGGESGKNARPCDVDWICEGVRFCRENRVAAFVKQLGKKVIGLPPNGDMRGLLDSHGGDWSEWPEDLRIRQFP